MVCSVGFIISWLIRLVLRLSIFFRKFGVLISVVYIIRLVLIYSLFLVCRSFLLVLVIMVCVSTRTLSFVSSLWVVVEIRGGNVGKIRFFVFISVTFRVSLVRFL